ncbi:MAG TPA: DUF2905 domain-containing protein [bacterium]|nr:DUF2905 domain-containing protein [Candidatus Omnitrophota bacterium]HOJ59465.1 DUF2905 domain-containing protein [bacterium]HOL94752.1 DUF2905 domain-containing protein [bacterium]HPP00627.1 DUF2905 domain-containing protein [bacterium]HXK92212.1 DUF2905 domain-containing protein [bacterium]
MFTSLGKWFLILGGFFLLLGFFFLLVPHVPWLGKLPGDIHYQGKRVTFYFPLTTCIILSVLMTILMSLIHWLK